MVASYGVGGLAVAVAADQRDGLAHELEQRLDLLEDLLAPANHEGERRGLGADLSARHRRVEIEATQILDPLGELLGRDRRDRAHVHHDLARAQALGDAVLAEQHLLDIGRIGHHHENDVGLRRDIFRRAAGDSALVEQVLRNFRARV